jgi:hypothetical protein
MPAQQVNEIIWHFAGYLRIAEDFWLARPDYDEGARTILQGRIDVLPGGDREGFEHDDADAASQRSAFMNPAAQATTLLATLEAPDPIRVEDVEAVRLGAFASLAEAAQIPVQLSFGFTLAGFVQPPAVYALGATDKFVEIAQGNGLHDRDALLDALLEEGALVPFADARPLLADMLSDVAEVAPEDLRLPSGDGATVLSFMVARDHARSEGELHPDDLHPHEVAAGRYVDGVASAETFEREAADEDAGASSGVAEGQTASASIDGAWPVGQEATLGANEAVNLAAIVDLNEASAGLIVMGDYYETNAIVQAIAYRDADDVSVDNGAGPRATPTALVQTGANTATNYAEFRNEDVGYTVPARGPGPVQFNIDVVEGDFFDVKSLRQMNLLNDNDFVQQTSTDIYSAVSTGENGQYNLAQIFDDAKSYDLIVVLGDFHEYNMVFQTLVLADGDTIEVLASPGLAGLGGATLQTLRAGENELVNDALIRNIGTPAFRDVDAGIESFVAQLQAGDLFLDPRIAYEMIGGSGTIDVLFVTGNYYDLNLISQMTVMSDMDILRQTAPEGGVVSVDEVIQSSSTGGNSLVNQATIVDVGTVSDVQYLGGDYYSDTILVQAEIVDPDENDVVYGDASALATEVIAFTDHVEPEPAADAYTATAYSAGQGDVMGGVLV